MLKYIFLINKRSKSLYFPMLIILKWYCRFTYILLHLSISHTLTPHLLFYFKFKFYLLLICIFFLNISNVYFYFFIFFRVHSFHTQEPSIMKYLIFIHLTRRPFLPRKESKAPIYFSGSTNICYRARYTEKKKRRR